MNCKKNIPCPMGGMACCIGCAWKGCPEKCGKQAECIIKMLTPTYKQIALAAFIIGVLIIAIAEVVK